MAKETAKDKDCLEAATPEEALVCALDQMEAGSGLPLEPGLRKKVGDLALDKFKKNHGEWPTLGRKVLRSARKVGEYAEEFALFEAEINEAARPEVVMERHVREAIHAVSRLCPARTFLGEGKRFKWCPEP